MHATNEVEPDALAAPDAPNGVDMPGVVRELGELAPGAIITEAGLASMLGRCQTSIKRAVSRGELPPSARLLGQPVWTAGTILAHLEKRLADAAKEAERTAARITALRP